MTIDKLIPDRVEIGMELARNAERLRRAPGYERKELIRRRRLLTRQLGVRAAQEYINTSIGVIVPGITRLSWRFGSHEKVWSVEYEKKLLSHGGSLVTGLVEACALQALVNQLNDQQSAAAHRLRSDLTFVDFQNGVTHDALWLDIYAARRLGVLPADYPEPPSLQVHPPKPTAPSEV